MIQTLQSEVRLLQRQTNRRDTPTANRCQDIDGHHVPGLRREGGNRHDINARGTWYHTQRGTRITRRPTVNDIGTRHGVPSGPHGPIGGPSGQTRPTRRQTVNRAQNMSRSPATTAPVVPDEWTVPPHRQTPAQPDRPVSLHRTPPYGMPYAPTRTPRHNNSTAFLFELIPTFLERVAMLAPSRFISSIPFDSSLSVIWDSGASITISPDKRDFVGKVVKPSTMTQLKGIAKGLRIEGEGRVCWSFHDTNGQLRTLELPAYYVLKIRVRLLSTTSLLQTYHDKTIKVEAHQLTLSGNLSRSAVIARVNPDNNLPTSQAYRQTAMAAAAEGLSSTIATVNESNFNLSEPEKELLRWHYRLGHIGF